MTAKFWLLKADELLISQQRKLKPTFQPEKGGKLIPRNWGKDLGTESSNVSKGKGEDW